MYVFLCGFYNISIRHKVFIIKLFTQNFAANVSLATMDYGILIARFRLPDCPGIAGLQLLQY